MTYPTTHPASYPLLQALDLPPSVLGELVRAFSAAIARGLAGEGQPIQALRAFLRPPDEPKQFGRTVAVIDMGGTNGRAALLSVEPTGLELIAGPVERQLPLRSEQLSADTFFALQAELLAELNPPPGLSLGYCFSYPALSEPTLDARLIRWTKGVDIAGVVGQPVGLALCRALERQGIAPTGVVVLNDTVACLMGAALAAPPMTRHLAIGLIAGTGTNMAGFFDARRAPKLGDAVGPMAINLESGNFCPPLALLTAADHAIDRGEAPGAQRFEKAVSGYYLPQLFREILPAIARETGYPLDPSYPLDLTQGAAALAALLTDDGAPAVARELARALCQRSANLIAAGLAALLEHYPEGQVTIAAEGSLFWLTPGYSSQVTQTLAMLVSHAGGAKRFSIIRKNHINLFGAACAALQAKRL